MFYSIENNFIKIHIKAQPGSSKTKIASKYGDAIKINIAAAAVDGAANKELIKFLSKYFKVPKSSIIIKGETSKIKTLYIPLTEYSNQKIKELNDSLK